MPTLQPPGRVASAPFSQLTTWPPFSPPKPRILNGLPLSFSSAASVRPSLRPFGAVHVDWPLITISWVSLRESVAFHSTSTGVEGDEVFVSGSGGLAGLHGGGPFEGGPAGNTYSYDYRFTPARPPR